MRPRRATRRFVCLSGALALCACAGPRVTGVPAGVLITEGPFAAASLRVFPLTRVETPPHDAPRIVCHVECKDRWGDTVKSRGTITIELVQVLSIVDRRIVRTWTQDLSDLDANAAAFDPVTRTYRFVLAGVPEWVGRDNTTAELRVVLRLGEEPDEHVVADTYELSN